MRSPLGIQYRQCRAGRERACGDGPLGTEAAMREINRQERPLDLVGVPEEEDIDPADAAERVDEDPEEVPNRRDVPDDAVSLAEETTPEDR